MAVLLQIADTTKVAEGHQLITDQINVLTVVITAIVVIGLILIVRYIVKEKIK